MLLYANTSFFEKISFLEKRNVYMAEVSGDGFFDNEKVEESTNAIDYGNADILEFQAKINGYKKAESIEDTDSLSPGQKKKMVDMAFKYVNKTMEGGKAKVEKKANILSQLLGDLEKNDGIDFNLDQNTTSKTLSKNADDIKKRNYIIKSLQKFDTKREAVNEKVFGKSLSNLSISNTKNDFSTKVDELALSSEKKEELRTAISQYLDEVKGYEADMSHEEKNKLESKLIKKKTGIMNLLKTPGTIANDYVEKMEDLKGEFDLFLDAQGRTKTDQQKEINRFDSFKGKSLDEVKDYKKNIESEYNISLNKITLENLLKVEKGDLEDARKEMLKVSKNTLNAYKAQSKVLSGLTPPAILNLSVQEIIGIANREEGTQVEDNTTGVTQEQAKEALDKITKNKKISFYSKEMTLNEYSINVLGPRILILAKTNGFLEDPGKVKKYWESGQIIKKTKDINVKPEDLKKEEAAKKIGIEKAELFKKGEAIGKIDAITKSAKESCKSLVSARSKGPFKDFLKQENVDLLVEIYKKDSKKLPSINELTKSGKGSAFVTFQTYIAEYLGKDISDVFPRYNVDGFAGAETTAAFQRAIAKFKVQSIDYATSSFQGFDGVDFTDKKNIKFLKAIYGGEDKFPKMNTISAKKDFQTKMITALGVSMDNTNDLKKYIGNTYVDGQIGSTTKKTFQKIVSDELTIKKYSTQPEQTSSKITIDTDISLENIAKLNKTDFKKLKTIKDNLSEDQILAAKIRWAELSSPF